MDIGIRNGYYLSAVKCGVKAYGFFLKSRRTRYYLEYGAGVVQLGDSLVFPLLFPKSRIKLVVLVLFGNARKLCGIRRIIQRISVVQVEAGSTRHSLDRSGFSLHDYGAGAVLNVVSLHLLLKVFFRVVLQGHVQSQVKGIAVLRVVYLVVLVGHFVLESVHSGDNLSVHALQVIVVFGFNAVNAVSVIVRKAYYRRGKLSLRVVPLGVKLMENKVAKLFLACAGKYLVVHRFFHGFGYKGPVGVGSFRKLFYNIIVGYVAAQLLAEYCRRRVYHAFRFKLFGYVAVVLRLFFLFLLIAEHDRVNADRVHRSRLGKYLAVGIVNASPVCLDRLALKLGVVGEGLIFQIIGYGGLEQAYQYPARKRQKKRQYDQIKLESHFICRLIRQNVLSFRKKFPPLSDVITFKIGRAAFRTVPP